jgi:isopenicillin N synthase-like dioxygenase
MEAIPTLNLADFTEGDMFQKRQFVDDLGKIYEEIGFVAIRNHLLETWVERGLYESVKDFFALPDQVKQKYEDPALKGQRGYISKLKEHAKGRSVPDLKEFYHVGQTKEAGVEASQTYPDNVFPDEIPGLRDYTTQAYKALEATGIRMLQAIALYLELPENYFDDKVRHGNSILRPIHYFPLADYDVPEGAVRAAEHTDINLITLLMGASADGLEVLRRDGTWIPVTDLPGHVVVNVGDMLSRHTNNRLKSTVHRVVNPKGEKASLPRYSIPFFLHPVSEMDLSCLDSCIDDANPKKFPDITAGEFLDQRLAEIGF